MQTLNVTLPQPLRIQIQRFQNERGIKAPEEAIVAALSSYFETWKPAETSALPAMYDAEDGPCEVIDSFRQPGDTAK